MLLIYTPQITNRQRYIFDLLLNGELGIEYQLTTNEQEFSDSNLPKFSYGKKIAQHPYFFASELLFEKNIREQNPVVSSHQGIPVFFQADEADALLPFDIFSASFFLISRYEEYLPFTMDHYGRFPAEQSFQFKNNFLDVPVVDYYVQWLREIFGQYFPQIPLKKRQYKFIATYDIDSAYAYKNKGIVRNIGSIFLSITKGNFRNVKNILSVLTGLKNDPFDTYDLLHQLHEEFRLKPIYFFLVGDYDRYDKNISIHISEFKTLIKSIADIAEVGIHPSFASNTHSEKLKREIKSLSQILNRDIKKSRQHFLKLRFPETYRALLDKDITDDYSMGFASQPGFRAGYSKSFYFYDLEKEMKTSLRVHPFVFMDATFEYYQHLTPRQSLQMVLPMIEKLKQLNGTLIFLSHNASFCDRNHWVGWHENYRIIIEKAIA